MTEFVLSETEVACGVTMAEVEKVRRDAYVMSHGAVAITRGTGPALAGAAARLALGGPVEYVAMNIWDQPVYRRAS